MDGCQPILGQPRWSRPARRGPRSLVLPRRVRRQLAESPVRPLPPGHSCEGRRISVHPVPPDPTPPGTLRCSGLDSRSTLSPSVLTLSLVSLRIPGTLFGSLLRVLTEGPYYPGKSLVTPSSSKVLSTSGGTTSGGTKDGTDIVQVPGHPVNPHVRSRVSTGSRYHCLDPRW